MFRRNICPLFAGPTLPQPSNRNPNTHLGEHPKFCKSHVMYLCPCATVSAHVPHMCQVEDERWSYRVERNIVSNLGQEQYGKIFRLHVVVLWVMTLLILIAFYLEDWGCVFLPPERLSPPIKQYGTIICKTTILNLTAFKIWNILACLWDI
jgi:hypothetical protein